MTRASNVIGTVQPIAEIGRRCAARGVPVIVEVAQSAGQGGRGHQSCHVVIV